MADHTITLNTTQEDALMALTELYRQSETLPEYTVDDMLLRLILVPIQAKEIEIGLLTEDLRAQAHKLPDYLRERMTEGLTAEQLARLDFLLPIPPAERGDAR